MGKRIIYAVFKTEKANVEKDKLKVSLILDEGGVNDASFNEKVFIILCIVFAGVNYLFMESLLSKKISTIQ